MEAFDTIRSYSVDAARTLREAVAHAGAELYLEHCALPYESFFECVPADHIRFFEACVFITRPRIACAPTVG
jgi:hypothetical protein